tara:strand:+ start:1431 stop:2168 length:738 start_codon:yes stop_codon:yes gene_type:complete
MPNYQNGLIYKLVCNDLNINEAYYGSTTNFEQRKKQHKRAYNNINCKCYNHPKYKFIRENGGWDNWKMILIKDFPCNNKRELERAERYEMEQDGSRLNTILPTRTKEEWCEENKEKIAEYQKIYQENNKEQITKQKEEYYQNNKELIIKQNKEYREVNKELISEKAKIYRENNREQRKEYIKEYREVNKEQILKQNKEYREVNKQQIKEKVSVKVTCECGSIVIKRCLAQHKRTKKHLKYDSENQ